MFLVRILSVVVVMLMMNGVCWVSAAESQDSAASLEKELAYLKSRNDVLRLSDRITAKGEIKDFDQLRALEASAEEDLRMIAVSEMIRIRNYFDVLISKEKVEVTYDDHGTPKTYREKDIPTSMLLVGLKSAPSWTLRARIADILKNKKEKGVPDALLESSISDVHAGVRERALSSFKLMTNYSGPEDSTGQAVVEWWTSHAQDINSTLSELPAPESVANNQ